MLPEEFNEKTGILSETAYLAANAIYMADENGNKWLNNSEYCAALVRSPKMLIELINKMGELIAKNNEEHKAELERFRKGINNLSANVSNEKSKVTKLSNALLNISTQAQQILLQL